MHQSQCTRWNVHLVHWGSCIAAAKFEGSIDAMHEMECSSSRVLRLMHYGGAAVGIEVPQYKPFYAVPLKITLFDHCVDADLSTE